MIEPIRSSRIGSTAGAWLESPKVALFAHALGMHCHLRDRHV
jgi:hypothetical protein